MHLITFGTDEHMLEPDSRQHKRLLSYVHMVDAYTAVIFAKSKKCFEVFQYGNLQIIQVPKKNLIKHVFSLYTVLKEKNSKYKKETLISAQDPFEVGFLGYIMSLFLRVPLHVQIHTAVQSPISRNENKRSQIQYLLFLWVIRRAKSIRVVSSAIRDFLISKGIAPASIFKAPVIEELSPNIRLTSYTAGEKIQLLCLARFVYFKNIPTLLQAFSEIRKEHDSHLTIVGGGPLRDALDTQIKSLGLTSSVTIENWKPDVQDLYMKSHLYVVPSYYEGFGMVAIEALRFGLPTIITPDVGSREYVEKSVGGFVASGYRKEDLVQAIRYGITHLITLDPRVISESLEVPTKQENDTILYTSWQYALTPKKI